jgi:hypothetical protein
MLKTQDMLEKGCGSAREGGTQKCISLMSYVNPPRSVRNCVLHPLIHSFSSWKDIARYVGKSEITKVGLKYDM